MGRETKREWCVEPVESFLLFFSRQAKPDILISFLGCQQLSANKQVTWPLVLLINPGCLTWFARCKRLVVSENVMQDEKVELSSIDVQLPFHPISHFSHFPWQSHPERLAVITTAGEALMSWLLILQEPEISASGSPSPDIIHQPGWSCEREISWGEKRKASKWQ